MVLSYMFSWRTGAGKHPRNSLRVGGRVRSPIWKPFCMTSGQKKHCFKVEHHFYDQPHHSGSFVYRTWHADGRCTSELFQQMLERYRREDSRREHFKQHNRDNEKGRDMRAKSKYVQGLRPLQNSAWKIECTWNPSENRTHPVAHGGQSRRLLWKCFQAKNLVDHVVIYPAWNVVAMGLGLWCVIMLGSGCWEYTRLFPPTPVFFDWAKVDKWPSKMRLNTQMGLKSYYEKSHVSWDTFVRTTNEGLFLFVETSLSLPCHALLLRCLQLL